MRRGARVTALDYSAADLKDVAAVAGAMLEAAKSTSTQWAGRRERRRARPAVPRRHVRPRRSCPRCSSTSGTTSARSSRSCACCDPAAASRRRCRPAGPSASRGRSTTATTTRPAGTCASTASTSSSRSSNGPGCFLRGSHHAHAFHSPYWWLKCAYGLDNTDAAPVKRYHDFLVPPHRAQPALGARHRAGAEPGARQEPRRLRREGAADDGRNGGSAALTDARSSPRSPASSPRAEVAQTVDAIASVQQPDGNIPWVAGRPHRPVEPRRSRDGARRRRPVRRSRARVRVAARACSTSTARGTRTTRATRSRSTRSTPTSRATSPTACGTTTSRRATPASSSELFPVVERAIDFALDHQHPTGEIEWDADPDAHRRQGRVAHRLVEHLLVVALRDRRRRTARPRAPRLGAVARLARHRDRAPARALPRQGTLGDGLVLPDPRRRAARPRGRSARRVEVGHVRRAGPRRALRVGPAVDHRGRDVRARDGARRDRAARTRARRSSRGCSSCATTTAATGPA